MRMVALLCRIMGGLLVIGQGDAGIVYSHLETTFGDRMNTDQVVSVCENMMKDKESSTAA